MKIVFGSDHAGFKAKAALIKSLEKAGHTLVDAGPSTDDRVDYPDFAASVARYVSRHPESRGVLVCGTGIGMSIAANKIPGIRAAVVWSEATASLAAAHNRANVLCLSGRLFKPAQLARFVHRWLDTPFEGGRHNGRLRKIAGLEKGGKK